MNRLENMYMALEALKNMGIPVSQEQKDMLAKLEQEYLDNELVPAIKAAVEPIVENCRLPFKLEVGYTPDEGLSVKHVTAQPEMTTTSNENRKRRSKDYIAKVTFPDGKVVCHNVVKNTLVDVVRYAGLERVYSLRYPIRGIFLLAKEKLEDEKHMNSQVEIEPGWFLITNSSTDDKITQMRYLSHQLHLGLKVERISTKTGETISDATHGHAAERKPTGERSYDHSRFSLENGPFLNKTDFMFHLVETILKDNPHMTYAQLEQMLPYRSAGNKFLVKEDEWKELSEDRQRRYKATDGLLSDAQGTRFFISNQWRIDYFENEIYPLLERFGYKWERRE